MFSLFKSKEQQLREILDRAAFSDGSGQVEELKNFITSSKLSKRINEPGLIAGWEQYTLLTLCADRGHLALIRLLVSVFHADPNASDDYGLTPLMVASEHNRFEVAEYLVDLPNIDIGKINPKRKRGESRTALEMARPYHHDRIVSLLELKQAEKRSGLIKVATGVEIIEEDDGTATAIRKQTIAEKNILEQLTELQILHADTIQENDRLQFELEQTQLKVAEKDEIIANLRRRLMELDPTDTTGVRMEAAEEFLSENLPQLDQTSSNDSQTTTIVYPKARTRSAAAVSEAGFVPLAAQSMPAIMTPTMPLELDDRKSNEQQVLAKSRDGGDTYSSRLFISWYCANFPVKSGNAWMQYLQTILDLGLNHMDFWVKSIDYTGNKEEFTVKHILENTLHISNPLHVNKITKKLRKYEPPQQDALTDWLFNSVELGMYLEKFMEEGFDDLVDLVTQNVTDEMLQRLGVECAGHRLRILFDIEWLKTTDLSTPQTRGMSPSTVEIIMEANDNEEGHIGDLPELRRNTTLTPKHERAASSMW